MIAAGNLNDPVWMVIDNEVVPGRLIRIFEHPDSLESGLRVEVKYCDIHRGNIRGNFAEHVFAEKDYEAARSLAREWCRPSRRQTTVATEATEAR